MKIQKFPYRFADAVLTAKPLKPAYQEFLRILEDVDVPLYPASKAKVRQRKKAPARFFPVDQKNLNKSIERAVLDLKSGWEIRPLVVQPGSNSPKTKIQSDFKRDRIQVEVQFGNMARWYTDVFKFQLAYSSDQIDVGILVVPTQKFANLIDENVASFERVMRELPWAKMSLTLPILVLGVEPEDYKLVHQRYDEKGKLYKEANPEKRIRPFEETITLKSISPVDED
jgi:hypothetical protein